MVVLRTLAALCALACTAWAEGDFRVKFDIMTGGKEGSFVVNVHEDWAPTGAARFKELVQAGFFNNIRVFRVIPSFMAQFGISGNPQITAAWTDKTIQDDPVKKSNLPGFVTFAKTMLPNSRTTQIFINDGDNARLDNQGFAPFGEVEGDGMDVVRSIYDCGEEPNQGQIMDEGNRYLDANFPELTQIVKASVIGANEL
uniref:peptidylprolyl isomerase n=1 Tax=Alexandrium andersonii TaxID=327968 RepID=A0A7S2BT59_9DINO|mmetsp:Transcript_29238/g.66257  ORF Transcript_29238/g.66257 Transcript_29238/m.66257 type:complete len:199 (+) Transcript_29238:66-662(+)